MTEELNTKLSELAKIRDEQVTLEEKRRKIESEVFPILEDEGINSAETPYGAFNKKIVRSITYSGAVQSKIDELGEGIKAIKEQQDAIKAQAEADGEIAITTTVSYAYKATKI